MSKNFPATKKGFYTYLTVVIPYLVANAARLGVSAVNLALLNSLYGAIATVGTYLYYFARWSDVTGGRTKEVIDNLAIMEKKIRKLLGEIYEDIPVNAWTQDDRNKLQRKTGAHALPTVPKTPISHACLALARAMGSGVVKIGCKYFEDQTRPSKPTGVDAVEVAYVIVPVKHKIGTELSPKVKDMIVDPDDGTTKKIYTRATFTLDLGFMNAGNEMQFFLRWINTKHPGLEGRWAGPFSVIIG
jgi:hypothetical protein